jgi:hypothetical protein
VGVRSVDVSPYNTRFFKLGPGRYELRLASASGDRSGGGAEAEADPVAPLLRTYTFEGAEITLTRGDHAPFLAAAAAALDAAIPHAANPHQATMLRQYVRPGLSMAQ